MADIKTAEANKMEVPSSQKPSQSLISLFSLSLDEQELYNTLSGRQKCAIMLTILGEDVAANIFNHLDEKEIEDITLGLAALKQMPRNVTIALVKEFHSRAKAQEYLGMGGVEYARSLLEKALGSQKATEIIDRILNCPRVTASFSFMKESDISQLLYLVQNEHPQVIALLVSYMSPKQAGLFISALPPELQAEVAQRVALLTTPEPNIISQLQKVLGRNIVSAQKQEKVGGVEALVKIINQIDRSTEKSILRELSVRDPELAEEISSKLFVFEDVKDLSDQHIQLIIREIEMKELALALKGSDKSIYESFAKNMSERARDVLDEEMSALGRVKVKAVEDSQKKIVKRVKKLEEQGLLDLSRGGEATIG